MRLYAGFIFFSVNFSGGRFLFWVFLCYMDVLICCRPVKILFAVFEVLKRFFLALFLTNVALKKKLLHKKTFLLIKKKSNPQHSLVDRNATLRMCTVTAPERVLPKF